MLLMLVPIAHAHASADNDDKGGLCSTIRSPIRRWHQSQPTAAHWQGFTLRQSFRKLCSRLRFAAYEQDVTDALCRATLGKDLHRWAQRAALGSRASAAAALARIVFVEHALRRAHTRWRARTLRGRDPEYLASACRHAIRSRLQEWARATATRRRIAHLSALAAALWPWQLKKRIALLRWRQSV